MRTNDLEFGWELLTWMFTFKDPALVNDGTRVAIFQLFPIDFFPSEIGNGGLKIRNPL